MAPRSFRSRILRYGARARQLHCSVRCAARLLLNLSTRSCTAGPSRPAVLQPDGALVQNIFDIRTFTSRRPMGLVPATLWLEFRLQRLSVLLARQTCRWPGPSWRTPGSRGETRIRVAIAAAGNCGLIADWRRHRNWLMTRESGACSVLEEELFGLCAEEQSQLVEQDWMIAQQRVGIDDLECGLTSKGDQLPVTPQ
ncbi:MAG: hypothetical protein QOE09_472 [Ilumatobacteraceae bacterium]